MIGFLHPFRMLAPVVFIALLVLTSCVAAKETQRLPPAIADQPFAAMPIATFNSPWAIAFMPDGRFLVTEKAGHLFVGTQQGGRQAVSGVPMVQDSGQNGLLDVAISPSFDRDRTLYLSFVEPGLGGSGLALAVARLDETGLAARLADLSVIWRQEPKGRGNQPGGIITFSPDGQHLFLASGDRRRPETAQDPGVALGKVLRLNLDGSAPNDNPMANEGGVQAETYTSGHRNPYGLAFSPDGALWLHEMGPRGGDELNRLLAGRNYGWPIVSNGDNYDGSTIPDHQTRPDFQPPTLSWTPVISPAGLVFYDGILFPEWRGSALVGSLSATGLIRIAFNADGGAIEANRWNLGHRMRDVAVAPDGAVWVLEDGPGARLLRLVPHP